MLKIYCLCVCWDSLFVLSVYILRLYEISCSRNYSSTSSWIFNPFYFWISVTALSQWSLVNCKKNYVVISLFMVISWTPQVRISFKMNNWKLQLLKLYHRLACDKIANFLFYNEYKATQSCLSKFWAWFSELDSFCKQMIMHGFFRKLHCSQMKLNRQVLLTNTTSDLQI